MTRIHAVTIDQVLSATVMPKVACNNQNTVLLEVDFDDSWDGFGKSAIFYTSKNPTRREVVFSNDDICSVPSEVLTEAGFLFISVKGVSGAEVKTSTELKCRIFPGTPSVIVSEPTEDVYQQLMTAYGKANDSAKLANARVDNLIAMEEGSTTGDAELADIRVSLFGETYSVAGEAVRGQIAELDDTLITNIDYMYERTKTVEPILVDGFVRYTNGEISNDSMGGWYKRTAYIAIPRYCTKIYHNFEKSGSGNDGYAFFDLSKRFISGGQAKEITNIPTAARYLMVTSYDGTLLHKGKSITVQAKNISAGDIDIQTLVTFGDSHVARGGWQDEVINYFGIKTHVNLGIGSTTVAENAKATKLPFVDSTRIEEIKQANPDAIIIIGGTNDVHLDTPLGATSEFGKAIASKDKTTFYGAYSYLIETLLTWKPSLKMILCTTPQGIYDATHAVKYADVSDAIREIGEHYSLPICDIFGKCGINKTNFSTYSNDEIHFNELGNKRLSALMIDTISAGSAGRRGDKGEKGVAGEDGKNGETGATGLSAYQIAVAKGFEGTEEEWLQSLQAGYLEYTDGYWTVRRWNNGQCELWYRSERATPIMTENGSSYMSENAVSIGEYPVTFADIPFMTVTFAQQDDDTLYHGQVTPHIVRYGDASNGPTIRLTSPVSCGTKGYLCIYVKGTLSGYESPTAYETEENESGTTVILA